MLPSVGTSARAEAGSPDRDQAVELCRIAYEAFTRGDVEGAYSDFTAAESIFRSRVEENPDDSQAFRDLAVVNERLGDLHVRMNEGDKAYDAYVLHNEIIGELLDKDHENEQLLQDMIVGRLKQGDVSVWLARAEEAATAYEQGVTVCERLSRIAPANLDARRYLCLIWYRQSRLLERVGLDDKAETARGHESSARDALRAMDGDNGNRDLYVTYRLLGEQYELVGQLADSIAVFQESLGLADQLIQGDPGNVACRWELAFVFRALGRVHARLGQFDTAATAYERALEIGTQVANAEPSDMEHQRDLVVTRYKLGAVLEAGGKAEKAMQQYTSALSLAESMIDERGGDDRLQQDAVEIRKRIDGLAR